MSADPTPEEAAADILFRLDHGIGRDVFGDRCRTCEESATAVVAAARPGILRDAADSLDALGLAVAARLLRHTADDYQNEPEGA